MRWWGRSRALAAVVAVSAAGLAACGSGGVGVARSFEVEFKEPAPGEVLISQPSSIGAGLVSFRFRNSGNDPHDAQLFRVTGDHSREEVARFVRSLLSPNPRIPSWIRDGGGARGIPAGQTVVVKQRLDDGDWYLADLAYAEQGGLAAFTVTSGGSAAELPSTGSRIRAQDYSFTPRALKPGTHAVRFENRGKEMHEVVAFPLAVGHTLDEAKAYLATANRASPPTATPLDTTHAVRLPLLGPGERMVAEVFLTRGTWVLTCLLTDRNGLGQTHAAKGMVTEVKIG